MINFKQLNIPWENLSAEDFQRYIQGSFLRVKLPKQKTFQWKGIEDVLPPKSTVNFGFPKTGAYNFKQSVLVFTRRTRKQYKRGICTENSFFLDPFDDYEGKERKALAARSDFSINEENLETLFSSKYLKFKDAFSQVSSGKALARAMNHDFFMTIGAVSPNPVLWYYTIPIGFVLSELKVSLLGEEFSQEVKDNFKDLEISVSKKKEKAQDHHGDIAARI